MKIVLEHLAYGQFSGTWDDDLKEIIFSVLPGIIIVGVVLAVYYILLHKIKQRVYIPFSLTLMIYLLLIVNERSMGAYGPAHVALEIKNYIYLTGIFLTVLLPFYICFKKKFQ